MSAMAQISVTATAGTTGPSSYTNLRLAFVALNNGTHQGDITIAITADPAMDSNTAVLNASGSGSASYSSVLIRPTGIAGSRSIVGTVNGAALVDLNGADNVTVDGRNGDGYSLTFSNQSTSSSAGTSTIRFVNDASDNTLVDLYILGRSTGAVGTLCGNIIFGTGTSTGNDDNTIDHCILANDGTSTTDLMAQALVALGSTGNLAIHNSNNTVEDCLLHDFFHANGSRGIHLGDGNHAWILQNNRFFQTAPRTTAAANSEHHIIHLGTATHADAGGHRIDGNVLGHADAFATGTWELSGSTNRFRAIYLAVPNTAPRSHIIGNSIAGITHTSSASGTQHTSPSTLIHIQSGTADVLQNALGSQSDTASVVYTPSSSGRHFHAILNATGADLRVAQNSIGGIIVNGISRCFGILNMAEQTWQCDSNMVGGNTAHSIRVTGTGATAEVIGVASTAGSLSTHGNRIRNLSSMGGSVSGLNIDGADLHATEDTLETIRGRYIAGVYANDASVNLAHVHIQGLYGSISSSSASTVRAVQVTNDSLVISSCMITDLDNPSTSYSSHLRGICAVNAVVTATENNIVGLMGLGPNGTVRGVVGMHVDHGSLFADDNLVDSLFNAAGHAVGIQIMDAPLSGNRNVLSALSARTVFGILAERSPCFLSHNRIGPLAGVLTSGSSTTVSGIAVTDSTLVGNGNRISALSNGATGASATVRGVHTTRAAVRLEQNTITGLQGSGIASSVAGVVGVLIQEGSLDAQQNTISDLSNSSTLCIGLQVEDGTVEATDNTIERLAANSVNGVYVLRSPATLTGNRISSLRSTITSTSNTMVQGIYAEDSSMVALDNVIHRLVNEATGGSAHVMGIASKEAPLVAQGNNISSLLGNGQGATIPGVSGIQVEHTLAHTHAHLANNRVHTLYSTQSNVIGIHALLRDTTNLIENNTIHALWRTTSAALTRTLTGIHLGTGNSTVRNNMIAIGADSTGASIPFPLAIRGIRVDDGTHAILHNTVYIGGEVTTSSTNSTYALQNATTGTRDHRNNILWNARSNSSGGSAKHYAVGVNASLTGLVSDNNCLYVTGTDGVLGQEGSTNRSNLGAWQSATGLDGNSLSSDPGLVRPVANSTEVDLHIQHNSAGAAAISRAGATGTGVQNDHDGATRHSPPDIGADQILLVLADFYEEPENKNILFRRNKGQVANNDGEPQPGIKFYSEGGFPRTYLHDDASFSLVALWQDTLEATPDTTWRVDVRFTGDKVRTTTPQPMDQTGYHHNYYLPWCGSNGAEQVYAFQRVVYEDVYPYTDVHFYSGSGGLKMAFVIRPGGDLANIQFEFDGQDSLTVDGSGFLVAHIGNMSFPLIGGIAYQVVGGSIMPLGITTYLNSTGSPEVDMGMSLFSAPADPDLPLVILVSPPPMAGGGLIETPGLCWSTYFGGDGGEQIHASTQDEQGNYFVAGGTRSDFLLFPQAPGTQIYATSNGEIAFVAKTNSQDQMVWRVFLGGQSSAVVRTVAVVTKPSNGIPGRVYLAGYTNSNTLSTAPNSIFPNAYYQSSNSNSSVKGFLASFNNSGAPPQAGGQRLWTTYFGDDELFLYDMAKADNGNLYITGLVLGALPNVQDAPPSGSEDYGYQGSGDAFVAMFNGSDRLNWRTHYGGTSGDMGKCVVANESKVVIAGHTQSADMITVNGGSSAYNEPFTGPVYECFIAEFDLDGVQQWGTCFGGGQGNLTIHGRGLALDRATEDVVISGQGANNQLDVVAGPGWYNATPSDAFLARFSGADRSLIWSTYLYQGVGQDWRVVIFDKDGNLYVSGLTSDSFSPVDELDGMYQSATIRPDVTYYDPDIPEIIIEEVDIYVIRFSPSHTMEWRTYFGGEAGPSYEAIHTLLPRNGDLYAGGFTTKSTFHWVGPYFESFFPLHDPLMLGVHFAENYGDAPSTGGLPTADAFITRFCVPPLTSVHDPVQTREEPLRGWQAGDQLFVAGLPAGTYEVSVTDASGRTVAIDRARSDGNLAAITIGPVAEGVYLLHFPDIRRYARLFITR